MYMDFFNHTKNTLKNFLKYIRNSLYSYKVYYEILNFSRSKTNSIFMDLGIGLGDYLWARLFINELVNHRDFRDFNIQIIVTKRWYNFALKYDNFDRIKFIVVPESYVIRQINNYQVTTKNNSTRKIFIDFIGITPSERKTDVKKLIPSYFDNIEKYNYLIKDSNSFFYKESVNYFCKTLFKSIPINYNDLSKYFLRNNNSLEESFGERKISDKYIIFFYDGYTRGIFSIECIKLIVDFCYRKFNTKVFLVSGKMYNKSMEIMRELTSNIEYKDKIINSTNKFNTYDLLNLIYYSEFTICTDSAPYHISMQLNKMLFCISNKDIKTINKEYSMSKLIIYDADNLENIPLNLIKESLEDFSEIIIKEKILN